MPPWPDPLRVELGGGRRPRPGWVNVDLTPGPDVHVVLDLDRDRLPFADESVSAVYSSHCLEHLTGLRHVLREVCRVCRVGAPVEVRVPHWLSEMALCQGHHLTVSDLQVAHFTELFVDDWWAGSPRRLRHLRTEKKPSHLFGEASRAFPALTREQVLQFVPGTCHEARYHLEVIPHAG